MYLYKKSLSQLFAGLVTSRDKTTEFTYDPLSYSRWSGRFFTWNIV